MLRLPYVPGGIPFKISRIPVVVLLTIAASCMQEKSDNEMPGSVSGFASFPPLPPHTDAATVNDSVVYYIHGSPPTLHSRLLTSSTPESLFTFPIASRPSHITIRRNRIAISDVGLNGIWTNDNDSTYLIHTPGVYRAIIPRSAAWLTMDSIVFSGLWLSRSNNRLAVHQCTGSYDISTRRVVFDQDILLSMPADSSRSVPPYSLVGDENDVWVIDVSGDELIIQSWRERTTLTIASIFQKESKARDEMTIINSVSGGDAIIWCLLARDASLRLLRYDGKLKYGETFIISDFQPGLNLIGVTDDLIFWCPSTGELRRFAQNSHTSR